MYSLLTQNKYLSYIKGHDQHVTLQPMPLYLAMWVLHRILYTKFICANFRIVRWHP